MRNYRLRLRQVETSLTPRQVVLLWMKDVLPHKYEEGLSRSLTRPREGIANLVARIVREGLKGEPESLVERAVVQARQEADWLYMIVVEVNSKVQLESFQSEREYLFLLAYLTSTMHLPPSPISEAQLRSITLTFVEPILLLEGAVQRMSAERFDAQPILFADSVVKLNAQLDLVDETIHAFNLLARYASFPLLSKNEISESLDAAVGQQVSRWSMIARGGMLAALGEWHECKATFKQLAATYDCGQPHEQRSS